MIWPPIPGETPIDPTGIRIKGITTRAELNRYEADNLRKAHVKYLAAKPSRKTARFDQNWMKRLHKEMFGEVWTWAGEFRQVDLNIGIKWSRIPIDLQQLIDDLAYWEKNETYDALEQAVRLHYRAVQIHPFRNGNGRWSRLMANIWLRLHDQPITVWPEQEIGQEGSVRQQYLAALLTADETGDYDALIEIHRRFTPPIA